MAYFSPIPQLGLGTFGRTGDDGLAAIQSALEIGYRHLDTAQVYDTESAVGKAVRRAGLSRGEVFITTKVADENLAKARFLPSVERSVQTLGVDQVDLLLIHWPSFGDAVPFEDYMLELAKARDRGLTRLIGVSNFPIALLERSRALLGDEAIATNQVEINPYLQAPNLRNHARAHGLALTAYTPLAKGRIHSDPVLTAIGEPHGVPASTVALAFLMAEGHAVIPTSSSREHLRSNFAAAGLRLDDDEMQRIRALDRGDRITDPAKAPHWDD